ncbi:MAG: MFS transporter [Fimbriimonadaceae bacterium]|nr:MFS transporter [Alphaproteobacteria bacterium]
MSVPYAPVEDGFRRRLAIVYGGIFLVIGVYVPFFPVWLTSRGLRAEEIGVVIAIPVFAKVVMSPLVGGLADRTGRRRRILMLLAFGSLLSGVALHYMSGFLAVLICVFVLSLFWNPLLPLTEAIAIGGARERGLDYGRMRLWGSLSFIAANLIGGWLLDRAGADAGLYFIIGGFAFTFLMTIGIPAPGRVSGPGNAAGGYRSAAGQTRPLEDSPGWRALLLPGFLVFLVFAAILQSGHAVYYLFSALHWRGLGLSTTMIGGLWAIGVASEVLLFIWSARATRFFGVRGLMYLAAIAAAVRWTALGFDVPVLWLFAVQILHGLTFGAAHIAVVNYIADTIPGRLAGTAQSMNYAMTGIGMSLATLAAGPLYANLNGRAYWAMAGLAGVVLAAMGLFSLMTKKPENG